MSSQETTLELARQGDPEAIAALINSQLKPKGITAQAAFEQDCLHVMLLSGKTLNQETLVPYIERGMVGLGAEVINKVRISGQHLGEAAPAWSQEIILHPSTPISDMTTSITGVPEEPEAEVPAATLIDLGAAGEELDLSLDLETEMGLDLDGTDELAWEPSDAAGFDDLDALIASDAPEMADFDPEMADFDLEAFSLENGLDQALESSLDQSLGQSLDQSLDQLEASLDQSLGESLDQSLDQPLDLSLDQAFDQELSLADLNALETETPSALSDFDMAELFTDAASEDLDLEGFESPASDVAQAAEAGDLTQTDLEMADFDMADLTLDEPLGLETGMSFDDSIERDIWFDPTEITGSEAADFDLPELSLGETESPAPGGASATEIGAPDMADLDANLDLGGFDANEPVTDLSFDDLDLALTSDLEAPAFDLEPNLEPNLEGDLALEAPNLGGDLEDLNLEGDLADLNLETGPESAENLSGDLADFEVPDLAVEDLGLEAAIAEPEAEEDLAAIADFDLADLSLEETEGLALEGFDMPEEFSAASEEPPAEAPDFDLAEMSLSPSEKWSGAELDIPETPYDFDPFATPSSGAEEATPAPTSLFGMEELSGEELSGEELPGEELPGEELPANAFLADEFLAEDMGEEQVPPEPASMPASMEIVDFDLPEVSLEELADREFVASPEPEEILAEAIPEIEGPTFETGMEADVFGAGQDFSDFDEPLGLPLDVPPEPEAYLEDLEAVQPEPALDIFNFDDEMNGAALNTGLSAEPEDEWMQPDITPPAQGLGALDRAEAAAASGTGSSKANWMPLVGGLGLLLAGLLAFGIYKSRTPEGPAQQQQQQTETPGQPATSADPFGDAVNAATLASELVQTAKTAEDWKKVADTWQKAIDLMKQVPESSPNFKTAQQRAVAYQPNLKYAQETYQRLAAETPQ